jgi:ubiquinone/menaquinone biosynthesis C-methylase UbiE
MLAGQSYRRNLAIPAARRGAVVTGVDIAPNLLEQARERAKREAVEVTFDEGDAEELPYGDASFDLVISMFGAMFAPRPELVATELMRICRPGGSIAMANWTAGAAP